MDGTKFIINVVACLCDSRLKRKHKKDFSARVASIIREYCPGIVNGLIIQQTDSNFPMNGNCGIDYITIHPITGDIFICISPIFGCCTNLPGYPSMKLGSYIYKLEEKAVSENDHKNTDVTISGKSCVEFVFLNCLVKTFVNRLWFDSNGNCFACTNRYGIIKVALDGTDIDDTNCAKQNIVVVNEQLCKGPIIPVFLDGNMIVIGNDTKNSQFGFYFINNNDDGDTDDRNNETQRNKVDFFKLCTKNKNIDKMIFDMVCDELKQNWFSRYYNCPKTNNSIICAPLDNIYKNRCGSMLSLLSCEFGNINITDEKKNDEESKTINNNRNNDSDNESDNSDSDSDDSDDSGDSDDDSSMSSSDSDEYNDDDVKCKYFLQNVDIMTIDLIDQGDDLDDITSKKHMNYRIEYDCFKQEWLLICEMGIGVIRPNDINSQFLIDWLIVFDKNDFIFDNGVSFTAIGSGKNADKLVVANSRGIQMFNLS